MKDKIYFDSEGISGNVYCVLSETLKILNHKGEYEKANELTKQVVRSKSYAEALKHIREHANVIDVKDKY